MWLSLFTRKVFITFEHEELRHHFLTKSLKYDQVKAARLALFTAFLAFDTGRFERRTSVHKPDTATDPRVTDLADAILRRDPATAVALAEAGDIESIGEQLRQAADIMLDGTQDPNQTCNAISIGLGFEAVEANLADVALPVPPPFQPCP